MATKQQLGTICSLFFGPTKYQAVGLWSVHYCTMVDLEPNTSRTYMGLCTVHVTPYPHSHIYIYIYIYIHTQVHVRNPYKSKAGFSSCAWYRSASLLRIGWHICHLRPFESNILSRSAISIYLQFNPMVKLQNRYSPKAIPVLNKIRNVFPIWRRKIPEFCVKEILLVLHFQGNSTIIIGSHHKF